MEGQHEFSGQVVLRQGIKIVEDANSLRAKFFTGNINMYLHFMSFLHIDMPKIPVIEILPRIRPGLTYFTQSISWLLMSWRWLRVKPFTAVLSITNNSHVPYKDKKQTFASILAHGGLNKMAVILQKTFSNASFWNKRFVFWYKFHLSFVPNSSILPKFPLVLVMAWHWIDTNALPEPMMMFCEAIWGGHQVTQNKDKTVARPSYL